MRRGIAGEKGLTLIEMLIVVGILGVLASIVIINVTGSISRGKSNSYTEDSATMQKAVDSYYTGSATAGQYPTCDGSTSSSTTSPSAAGVYMDFYYVVAQNLLRAAPASAGALNNVNTAAKANSCPPSTNKGTGNYSWFVDYKGAVHSLNAAGATDTYSGSYP